MQDKTAMQNKIVIPLIGIDEKSGKISRYDIGEGDIFYPILEFFSFCTMRDFLKNVVREDIQAMHSIMSDLLSSPIRQKELNKKLDLKKLEICFSFIHRRSAEIDIEHPFIIELLELSLHTCKQFKKIVNNKNTSVHSLLDTFISMMLAELSIISFSINRLQESEQYCRKQLVWLDTIQNRNPQDMAKRRFSAKITLAMNYFKFGYPETMLSLLQESQQIAKKFYYEEFDSLINELNVLCREIVQFYYSDNPNISMKIAQYFLILHETAVIKSNFSMKVELPKNIQFFNIVFNSITQRHQKEIALILDTNKAIGKHLLVEYNPKTAIIIVSPLDGIYFSEFKHFVKQQAIKFTSNKTQVHINSADCSAVSFESLCQFYCDFAKEQTLIEQTKKERIKPIIPVKALCEAQIIVSEPEYKPYKEAHAISFFSESSLTMNEEKNEISSKTKTKKSPIVQNTVSPVSCLPLTVDFHWENTNLTYCSLENNAGIVKKLSCNFLPDHVWFGYIPDWVAHDVHYTDEFEARLTRGLIQRDCIRDITKELKTTDNQALKFENSYKFKIVIPNQDYRLYGWIEEAFKDKSGKSHYLICFGCLENHKLLKLPDPIVIKQHQLKSDEKSGYGGMSI